MGRASKKELFIFGIKDFIETIWDFIKSNTFDLKITTEFYRRTGIRSGTVFKTELEEEYEYICTGEIYGGNLWFHYRDIKNGDSEMFTGVLDNVLNFRYLYNKSYSRTSKKTKVNTHIDYKKGNTFRRSKRMFIKLNWWERNVKIKLIMRETGYHRQPIEFILLSITSVGILATIGFQLITQTQIHKQGIQEQIQHKELIEALKTIDVQPENHIKNILNNTVVIDSIKVIVPKL